MTYHVCHICGHRDLTPSMLLSKATGRAYCRDEKACDLRKPTKEALMADGSTTSDLLTMEM